MLRRLFLFLNGLFTLTSKAHRSPFVSKLPRPTFLSFRSLSFFIALSFSFSLSFSFCFAQQGSFTHFGVEDGLPQSTVRSLLQDTLGRLWIATDGGVARYEGPRFTVFHKKDGLAEDKVTAMAKDTQGRIWFGHWGGGVSCYDSKTDTLFTVTLAQVKVNKPISAILADKAGKIWIGTEGLGLISFTPGDTLSTKVYGRQDGLLAKKIYCLMQDSKGVIWLGTELGVVRFLPMESRFAKMAFAEIMDDDVTAILEAPDKHGFLIGMRHYGLWDIKSELGDVWKCKEVKSKASASFHAVNTLVNDGAGHILLGTESEGLISLKGCNNSGEELHYTIANGLASNQVLSVLYDREGNVWAGTFLGLGKRSRADVQRFELREEGTPTPVYCVLQTIPQKAFVLGTERGLYQFDARGEQRLLGTIRSRVNALVRDRTGMLWASVPGRGVARISEEGSSVTWLERIAASTQVNCIGLDTAGNVWIGTLREGVFRVDPKTMRVSDFGISDGFQSNSVHTLLCDRAGTMWFGTPGGFITRFDGQKFKTFSEKEGLTDNFILCLAQDQQGAIWCGTYDGRYFKQSHGRFESVAIGIDYAPSAMVFDAQNKLWVAGGNGLFCYSNDTLNPSKSGLTGIEINANACLVDEAGDLWLGSMSGLLNFSPSQSLRNQQAPILHIDRMLVSFRPRLMEQDMQLKYDENFVSFEYTAISLTEPSKVRYQYQLQGLDKEWSPPSQTSSISYPNLQPGDYTFLLKACNNDGVWNKEPLAFRFHVAAPFWKTWWFWLILLLTLLFTLIAYIQWRVQSVERKEQQKTELNKKIANIELKALRAQMNPHFIFNTLNSIQHFVVHNDPDSAQKYLAKFGQLIRTILSNSSLAYITIAEELAYLELYLELESLRFENKFEYTINCDAELDTSEEIPSMLIQPYLENAIVHGLMHLSGKKGAIHLRLEKMDTTLKCTVEDNGVGRQRATALKAAMRPKHKSMGMAITSERLEILNNMNNSGLRQTVTDLTDEKGQASGTRVELFIPLSSEEE